jgi:hypothetical protein
MATFHVEGKAELIVLFDEFGISHVIEKCMCAMLGFHLGIAHVSKDDAYDANNNLIRSIYLTLVIGDLVLKWRVNFGRFKIVMENCFENFQNIILMPKTTTLVANAIPHLVEIKQEVLARRVDP